MGVILLGVLCFSMIGCKDKDSGGNSPNPPVPPTPPVKAELIVITDDVMVLGINTMKITVMPNNTVSANGFLVGNDKVNISNVQFTLTDKRDKDKFDKPIYSKSCQGVISTKSPCVITVTQHALQPVFHNMDYRISATNASPVDRSFDIGFITVASLIAPDGKNHCEHGFSAKDNTCILSIRNESGTSVDLHGATFSSKYVTFSNNDCTDHVIPNGQICQVTETLIDSVPPKSDVKLQKKGSYIPLICQGWLPAWQCMTPPTPPMPPIQ